jgi:hypothetical protein
MDTRIEVNEVDDFVDGDAVLSRKRDHYFYKKVMRERVISFQMKEGSSAATINTG